MLRFVTQLGPVLVIAARIRNTLLPWYSRKLAQRYESKRQGRRWTAESVAFRALYDRVNPLRVLDCPAGTGRWFETYQQRGAAVLGIDLSAEMLAEAARKLRAGARITLRRGDLLSPAIAPQLGTDHDLIVCTRFAHWLRLDDISRLAGLFAGTGSRFLIFGARVNGREAEAAPRPSDRSLSRLRHRSVSHVHDEASLLGILRERGWEVVERRGIGRGGSWSYIFYLLRRRNVAMHPQKLQTDA